MLIIRRALVWAATGGLIGVALWSLLAATIDQALAPEPSLAVALRRWPAAILYTAVWAAVVAAIAVPVYAVVFAVWQLLLRRRPSMDVGEARRAGAAFLLGAPVAAIVTWSFGSSFAGFDWSSVRWIAPVAFLSCWGAVWLPRRWLRGLRGPFWRPPSSIDARAA